MQENTTSPDKIRVLALFGGVNMLGSERGNLEALTAIKEKGAQVLLVVSNAPWAEEIRRDVIARGFDIFQSPYLTLRRPDNPINPLLVYPPAIIRASRQLRKVIAEFKPTHIHASNQLHVMNFSPALVFSRLPLVYRCGDKPVQHNFVFRAIWRFIARRTSQFVVVSKFISFKLQETGIPAEKISVIYSRPPKRISTSLQHDENGNAGVIRILFVGQINVTKGPQILIDAFERVAADFPQAKLVIAGRISDWEGDAWARDLRATTLANTSLAGRVSFPGFVEDVPGLMASCHLVVIPTLTEEPLANVVLESKQAGLASIIFPSGGLPETIEHAVDGFICRDNSIESLVDGLRFYLADPGKIIGHGQSARASLAKFRISDFSENWSKIYIQSFDSGTSSS